MKILIVFIFVLFCISCEEKKAEQKPEVNWSSNQSTDLNKELAEQERIDIQLYLDRNSKLKMTETGSGLRYFIYEEGNGTKAKAGMEAQVQFKITLLDGMFCYKTNEDLVDVFKIDQSQVETGVQEAIKLMRQGDKAKLIIPSHLAHGLTGDMNKIPPLTPIVVDLYLFKVV